MLRRVYDDYPRLQNGDRLRALQPRGGVPLRDIHHKAGDRAVYQEGSPADRSEPAPFGDSDRAPAELPVQHRRREQHRRAQPHTAQVRARQPHSRHSLYPGRNRA